MLAEYFENNVKDVEALPSGNDLLKQEEAFLELVDAMLLHRDVAALRLLRRALSQMHAESFDR